MVKKKKEVSVIDLIEEIEDKLAELKDKVDDQQDDFEDKFEDFKVKLEELNKQMIADVEKNKIELGCLHDKMTETYLR